MLRFIVACFVAPFPAAMIQALVVMIHPRPGRGVFEHPASMFVAACLLLYILGAAIGVPAFLVLRRSGPLSFRTHVFAGALAVLIPAGVLCAWGVALRRIALPQAAASLFWYGLLGLLTGAIFWVVARPDRRAASGTSRAGKAGLRRTFE
jgi:hypothetical protein